MLEDQVINPLKQFLLACLIVGWLVPESPKFFAQELSATAPDAGEPPRPHSHLPNQSEDAVGQIGAVLATRCVACHGLEKQEGSYSVASLARLRTAGDSEKTPVVAGKPDQSELLRRLTTNDDSERMPAEAEPLSASHIELFRTWIASGAKVSPEIETKALTEWVVLPKLHPTPEHYPTALPIAALALERDGRSAIVSGYGEVIRWELSTGEIKQRREVAGTQIADIEVSRDGHYLAVSSGTPGTQGVVQLWRLDAQGSELPIWSSMTSDIAADIAFAPNAPRLAVGRNDGSLLVLDILALDFDAARAMHTFTPHADAILAVAWSEAGDRMMTGSRDRTAKIFDAREMDLIANYDRHQRAVGGVAYLGDNPVSFDETGQLRLWTGDDNDRTLAERGNLPRFLEHVAVDGQLLLMPDGADVRTLSIERNTVDDGKDDEGKPKTKKVTRWSEARTLKSGGRSWILSLSHTGDRIAAGTESGEIVVWQDNDTAPIHRFTAKP